MSNEKLEAIQAEAQSLLEQIKQIQTQAEEFRKKAESEALFAFNAKGACEGHSTAISQLKGTVEAEVTSIATNKQKFDELSSFLTTNRPVVEADVKTIGESRKLIALASEKILEGAEKGLLRLEEIEESKKSVESFLREAEGCRDEAISARDKTNAAENTASIVAQKITSLHDSSTLASGEINAILMQAKTEKDTITEIISHLEKSHEITTGFENRVIKSLQELEALIVRATGLLPGFASASLAHSFNDEKKRFVEPQKRWLKTFVWCIVGIAVVALPSFIIAVFGPIFKLPTEQWGDIFRGMVMRLPILIPLVWLAIYAGRNYMLSLRLEEDYAYKEAISKAFEGYKREMKEIVADDPANPNPTPITKLCVNVLTAIAERPGRIYEGKHKDITPLNEARGAAEKVVSLSQKQLATQ